MKVRLEALIYNRATLLREDLLRNAIVNQGDPSRLQAFFRKLLAGGAAIAYMCCTCC